jgi:5S rRNA maturation endonuclease (ribonuclease M5)
MSVNKYEDHVLVLPEDDANRQIANGFILNSNVKEPAIQVLPIAGGWGKVVEKFLKNHVYEMKIFQKRMMVLLIDFDRKGERLSDVKSQIPEELQDRVFILGVLSDPEDLKRIKKKFESIGTGKLEQIGEALANDCSNKTYKLWGHDLLKHNKTELERMILSVKPFLFNKVNEE